MAPHMGRHITRDVAAFRLELYDPISILIGCDPFTDRAPEGDKDMANRLFGQNPGTAPPCRLRFPARMSTHALSLGVAGLAFLLFHASAMAFDGAGESGAGSKIPLQIFKNPQAALRAGLEGSRSGSDHWIEALKYAAAGGESLAQWKLGKMYASGDGVPHDDVKAYEYFSQIVASYDDDNPNRRFMPLVSNAFVALGIYYLNGIANTKISADPAHAMAMFHYAAINFGDPNAQYNLARMYLDGAGTAKDSRQAVRWLSLAADKNHYQAQALLGQVLFTEKEGILHQRARGLMWLTLAREAPLDQRKDKWIIDLYDQAMASASSAERQIALSYLENHLKRQD